LSGKIVVALVFGGRSAEHEVSLVSATAVHKNLDKAKFDVRSIYITRDGLWKAVEGPHPDPEKLSAGLGLPFLPWQVKGITEGVAADIYFPVLHGPYGEDGTIQGVFEMAGVPYVGAGVLGSALGMDKASAKSLFRDRGLPVVPWRLLLEEEWREDRTAVLRQLRREFALPFFIKPSNLGSSVGITKVKERVRTEEALERAFRYDAKVIVEKGIEGREIECSVLGNEAPEASLPGEVIPHREFYDYDDKYIEGKTKFVIPAPLPRAKTAKVRSLAVEAFKTLSVSGLARVDFFLERGTGRLYINEVNTLPGFTEISMYPKLWEASGLPFSRLLERLIALGFERHAARKACVDRDPG
jgi:D-alanine-D-alanine ligase